MLKFYLIIQHFATTNLMYVFVESTGTTASPPHRGRKTTRHIAGKVTRHIVPPTPTSPEYG